VKQTFIFTILATPLLADDLLRENIHRRNFLALVNVGSTSVLHWFHAIAQCNNSFLIVLCSTILNYIYHLCALEVVASGIDDIIVQTVNIHYHARQCAQ
jgi:hypothetical protein